MQKMGYQWGWYLGFAAANNGHNTHLLLIMRARISQKIVLHDLMNRNIFRKGSVYKRCTKTLFMIACGILIMLHTCILLLLAYNRRPTHTPGSMYKLVHFYIIKCYCRYYTLEPVTNLFHWKQLLICDNFGCHLQH